MINVAILGFGVVGSGVAELLTQNASHISKKALHEISLKYILDIRTFDESPFAGKFVKDFSIIENDTDVAVVVETIGGATIAYDFVRRSLLAGKSVVTSNKELVASYGAQLLALAKEKNVNFLFEASVGGGIPIIRPISQCLAANRISEIVGILNGTTNYILSQMDINGIDFDTALKQAQQEGYAEKDPTDDIIGKDTARKICILASLAFGKHIYPKYVQPEGITKITLEHIKIAKQNNFAIKLLGRTTLCDNGRVALIVAPHLVSKDHPLYVVSDVFNGIVVTGDALGQVMFYGRGAGKLPTASAVVADIIDSVKHNAHNKSISWSDTEIDISVPINEVEFETFTFPDGYTMKIL